MKRSFFPIAIAALMSLFCTCNQSNADLVASFEFDGMTTENFTALSVSGLEAVGGTLNGTATGNDPQLILATAGIGGLAPNAGETWTTVEFRVREIDDLTSSAVAFNSTGIVVGNAPGTVGPSNFTGTALDADGFTIVTGDISSFGSNSFATTFRLDPIGGALSNSNSETNGNSFELDYIRLYDTAVAVPEPTSLSILGLAGLGLISRRRRN